MYSICMYDDSQFLKAKWNSRANKVSSPVGQVGEEGKEDLEMRCMVDQTE